MQAPKEIESGRMKGAGTIGIVKPAATRKLGGNHVTAVRWENIFRQLGWNVVQMEGWDGTECDVLVALHARKSHDSVLRFSRTHPALPIVVAGTGTDLYSDVPDGGEVRESLGLATRIVVLQGEAIDALPSDLRERARVIYQSVEPPKTKTPSNPELFEVTFLANIRPVKDPLTAVRAARLLPDDTNIRILHIGGSIDEDLVRELDAERAGCEAFVSLGELEHEEALAVLSRTRLSISTSRHEGGANVVSEALAYDVPIIATAIPGTLGLLGSDYPGTFKVGNAEALAEILVRASTDEVFYHRLREACREQAWVTAPSNELESWKRLLSELADAPNPAPPVSPGP